MRPGDIIEHYQGTFAKVIAVGEGGLTWLSAWVRTPELAENETVAVTWLNDYGLNQVMKTGTMVASIVTDVPEVAVAAEPEAVPATEPEAPAVETVEVAAEPEVAPKKKAK
jgi:hypothetical protein